MQIIRAIVILFGLFVVAVGLYLFVLGVGAPIEIKSIEVGSLKASATGTFVGLLVAGVGLGVLYLAMHYFKRSSRTRTEEHFSPPVQPGEPAQPTVRITENFVTMAPPNDF